MGRNRSLWFIWWACMSWCHIKWWLKPLLCRNVTNVTENDSGRKSSQFIRHWVAPESRRNTYAMCAWRHKYEWVIVLALKVQLISWRYKISYKVSIKQSKIKGMLDWGINSVLWDGRKENFVLIWISVRDIPNN